MKFGSYGIEVLEASDGLRVSSLYSVHDGFRINRTFAVVAYPDVIEPAFKKEHAAIINGQSIGILFKEHGWAIKKQHLYFGEIEVPFGYFSMADRAGFSAGVRSAIHVYALMVKKDDSEFQYARIAEVHHPEFLQLRDLIDIYGQEFENQHAGTVDMDDVFKMIESNWPGTPSR